MPWHGSGRAIRHQPPLLRSPGCLGGQLPQSQTTAIKCVCSCQVLALQFAYPLSKDLFMFVVEVVVKGGRILDVPGAWRNASSRARLPSLSCCGLQGLDHRGKANGCWPDCLFESPVSLSGNTVNSEVCGGGKPLCRLSLTLAHRLAWPPYTLIPNSWLLLWVCRSPGQVRFRDEASSVLLWAMSLMVDSSQVPGVSEPEIELSLLGV